MNHPRAPEWLAAMRRCEGKDKLDKANATKRAAQIRKRDGTSECEAYECRHCGQWHVGHSRPGMTR